MTKITIWVIMDKDRNIIACGNPRDRELCFVKGLKKRILTYGTKQKAESAITSSGFFHHDVSDYIAERYIKTKYAVECWESILEPVKCELSEIT